LDVEVLSKQSSVLGSSWGGVLARRADAEFLPYRMSDETLERWRSRGFDRWLWPGLER